jgi:hypothetical protein
VIGANCPLGDPAEARTQDPQIKSLLLYQLSYGVIFINKMIPAKVSFISVTRPGFEPRQAESESAVLPLYYRAIKNANVRFIVFIF